MRCWPEPIDRETVGLEYRTARTQIRPFAFLRAHNNDEFPLESLGAVRAENPNAVGGGTTFTNIFGRDLLGEKFAQQVDDVE
jgi:hypothetical protein